MIDLTPRELAIVQDIVANHEPLPRAQRAQATG